MNYKGGGVKSPRHTLLFLKYLEFVKNSMKNMIFAF